MQLYALDQIMNGVIGPGDIVEDFRTEIFHVQTAVFMNTLRLAQMFAHEFGILLAQNDIASSQPPHLQ